MIKVNYVNYQTIEKYKDNQWLEVFPESEDTLKHHYFEFYSDDEPIGFWRLRHKDGITNHGNNFVYYEHRGKGWGNKILFISMNVIKEIFPDTKIFYVQCIFTNNRNLHIRDKQFGIENRYLETAEPNRFGFMEKCEKDYIYYDSFENVWNRNKKDIDKLKVVYEG